jgi:hypothetical protein
MKCIIFETVVHSVPPRAVLWPEKKKKNWDPPDRGGIAKNLYTEQERLTLSCRVTWAWSERGYFTVNK